MNDTQQMTQPGMAGQGNGGSYQDDPADAWVGLPEDPSQFHEGNIAYSRALYPVATALKGVMEAGLEANPWEQARQVASGRGLWGKRLSAGQRLTTLAWMVAPGAAHSAGVVTTKIKLIPNSLKALGKYEDLVSAQQKAKDSVEITGQIHHLLQSAAFKAVIPHEAGISINLKGNILSDLGSEHRIAHEVLEDFWAQYRSTGHLNGTTPTIGEYMKAVEQGLRKANLTKNEIGAAKHAMIRQLRQYQLSPNDLIPRIPRKIHLPGRP